MSAMRRSQFAWLAPTFVVLLALGLGLPACGEPHSDVDPVSVKLGGSPDVSPSTAQTPAPPGDHAEQNSLEVVVLRAEDDAPLAGAQVWFEPRGSSDRPAEHVTDATGKTRWTNLGPVDRPVGAFECAVGATALGRVTVTERVYVPDTGSGPPLVLRLEAQRNIVVHLVNAAGDDVKPEDLGLDAQAGQSITVVLSGACGAPGEKLDTRGAPAQRVRPMSWDGHRFGWRVDVRGVEPACVHVVVGDTILAARPLDADATDVPMQIDPTVLASASPPFDVRTVAAEDGRPLANISVLVRTPAGFEVTRTTDATGRVHVGGMLSGEFLIQAESPAFSRTQIRVRQPLPKEVELRLTKGRTVSGFVVDENDQPFPLTRVAIYRADQLGKIAEPMETRTTGLDARFEFLGMPLDELVLFGIGKGDGRGFLPPRASLPPTARIVPAGEVAGDLRVRGFVESVQPVLGDRPVENGH